VERQKFENSDLFIETTTVLPFSCVEVPCGSFFLIGVNAGNRFQGKIPKNGRTAESSQIITGSEVLVWDGVV
jgi:hypothetical protein